MSSMAKTVFEADRATWRRSLSKIGEILGERLSAGNPGSSGKALWWGGGGSDLFTQYAGLLAGELTIADAGAFSRSHIDASKGAATKLIELVALEDLRRDVAGLEKIVTTGELRDARGFLAMEKEVREHFAVSPTIGDGSASVAIMEFALNRVDARKQTLLLSEGFRILERFGRILALTLVADEVASSRLHPPGETLDKGLRAPTEGAAIAAFEDAGFHGVALHWIAGENPEAVARVAGADIRMCVIEAHKGKQGPCRELGQAVMYCGPWREVRDDDGHSYRRGERTSVCAKTYELMTRAPYEGQFLGLRRLDEPALADAAVFDCSVTAVRDPKVTKGLAPLRPAADSGAGKGCC